MIPYIFIIYLSTYGTSSGMTVATAEFNSKEACEVAQNAAKESFNGMATQVRTVCVKK